MPVMMPADGTSPSYMPCAASGDSSRNGVPGSSSRSTRSRGSSLPRADVALARLFAAALHRRVELGAQIRDQRLHGRGVARELGACGSMADAQRAHRCGTQRVFVEQFAPDQHAADFAGAGADLVELGVAQ